MQIMSTRIVNAIGDVKRFTEVMRDSDGLLEIDASDLDENSAKEVAERYPLVESIIRSQHSSLRHYQVTVNIPDTREGIAAGQKLLSGLSERVLRAAPAASSPDSAADGEIKFSSIAGGMTIGLAGGLGVGMALDTLRSTASSSGIPMLSGLSVGLGLLGTAVGAHVAAGGDFKIKILGMEIGFGR